MAGEEVGSLFRLPVRLSWGHHSPAGTVFHIRFRTNNLAIIDPAPEGFEAGDTALDQGWETRAGAGDVDGLRFTLACTNTQVRPVEKLHRIWADLIAQSDPDTARRLRNDAVAVRDERRLTVQLDAQGTRGFSVTVPEVVRYDKTVTP
jgi:hypothetical protein